MSTGGERSESGRNKQPAVLTWTEFDNLLETMTAELRSESAAGFGSGADEAQALPTSDGDWDNGLPERRASRAVAVDAPTEDLEQDALPGFLTAHYGRSWSERTVVEFLASAAGGQHPALKRTTRPRTLAAVGATLLVAVTAASTGMVYWTSWREDDGATTERLKQAGYVAGSSLLEGEALDVKAAPVPLRPRPVKVMLVQADPRDAGLHDDITLDDEATLVRAAVPPSIALDAIRRTRPSTVPATAAPADALDLVAAPAMASVAPGAPRQLAYETDGIGSPSAPLDAHSGPTVLSDMRESEEGSRHTTSDEVAIGAPAPTALASVEGMAGAKPLPDRFGAVVASTDGPVAAPISEQDVEAMLARADGLLRSGDIASAKLLLEQAADPGDAQAVATAHGSAANSRLPVLVLALNNVAASADVLGPSDKAVVPAQIRKTRKSVSGGRVALAPPEKGGERRPPAQAEGQPLARTGKPRGLTIATFQHLVRAAANGSGDGGSAAAQQLPGRYAGLPPAGGHPAGSQAWLDYCSAKFRSFDSATGTYQGYSGRQRYCR